MRKEYVQTNSRQKALTKCWWAAYIKKATDGYWCFECYHDYKLYCREVGSYVLPNGGY